MLCENASWPTDLDGLWFNPRKRGDEVENGSRSLPVEDACLRDSFRDDRRKFRSLTSDNMDS